MPTDPPTSRIELLQGTLDFIVSRPAHPRCEPPFGNTRNTNTIRYVMVNGPIYDGNTLDEIYPRQCRMEPVLGTPMRPQANAGIVP